MFSMEGEGSRVGGCHSREGLSPGNFSQVLSFLAGVVLEKIWVNKRHPPSKTKSHTGSHDF